MMTETVRFSPLPSATGEEFTTLEMARFAEFPAPVEVERFDVVMLKTQPCVMLPLSIAPSSCTKSDQVPFGFVLLKFVRLVLKGDVGAGAGKLSLVVSMFVGL